MSCIRDRCFPQSCVSPEKVAEEIVLRYDPVGADLIPIFSCQKHGGIQSRPDRFVRERLQGGDQLPLDGGELRVLGPLHEARDKEDNNSLVLFARAAGGSMLLAGDMEFPEESDLLSAGVIPQADVLKIGNHGDNDATSEALLNAVQPKVAVISTSTDEKSSTPSSRVLRLLSKWNVEVFQTQEAKTGILVTIRDGNIDVEIK